MTPFNLAGLKDEVRELQEEMAAPGFWDDLERAQKQNQRFKNIEDTLARHRALNARADDIEVLMELAAEDDSAMEEAEQELAALGESVEELSLIHISTRF